MQVRPYPSLLHGASLATAMQRLCRPLLLVMSLKLRRRSNSDYSPLVQGLPPHTKAGCRKGAEHLTRKNEKLNYVQRARKWISSHWQRKHGWPEQGCFELAKPFLYIQGSQLGKACRYQIRRIGIFSNYFRIKWARLFNPLNLRRRDPAETQSRIWRMSGWRYCAVRSCKLIAKPSNRSPKAAKSWKYISQTGLYNLFA